MNMAHENTQDTFMFNLTEDLLLAMEDAGVTKQQAADCLGAHLEDVEDFLNGDYDRLKITDVVTICWVCDAEIDVVITRDGKNVREEKT